MTSFALPFCLPDGMSAKTFLQEYWQKKPLLIKGGLPSLVGMFEPDDVLELALAEGVSARLISQADTDLSQWSVKTSPLSEADLDATPSLWTILIQNLEAWSPELGQLWQAFDFIPKWQQDDIMVSVAPAGGSVGQHYDEYDVFLAQGYGKRRWQLGKMCSCEDRFVPDQPIRLLDDMGQIIFDEVLEAGDVLYVPPFLSHYGVALDECLTFSFGFRRPNLVQILDELADVSTSDTALFSPLQLPQAPQHSAYQLSNDSIQAVKSQLIKLLASPQGDALFVQALAELVSKRQYELIAFDDEIDPPTLHARLAEGECLMVNAASRFVLADDQWYINGDAVCLDDWQIAFLTLCLSQDVLNLSELEHFCQANARSLDELITLLSIWVNDSWLILI